MGSLIGKTIESYSWLGEGPDGEQEGYCDLKLLFTDGTWATVHYSCMGGVYVSLIV